MPAVGNANFEDALEEAVLRRTREAMGVRDSTSTRGAALFDSPAPVDDHPSSSSAASPDGNPRTAPAARANGTFGGEGSRLGSVGEAVSDVGAAGLELREVDPDRPLVRLQVR